MKTRDIAIGAALLLLLSRKKAAGSTGPVPPRSGKKSFAEAWASRAETLLKRSRGGAAWTDAMTTRLGNRPAGEAAARWIGIESGGDPRAQSSIEERGLAQVSRQSLREFGLTERDFDAMISARTTDAQHADLAAKVIIGEMLSSVSNLNAAEPGWGPPVGPVAGTGGKVTVNGIAIGKLRHGLPLLVKELADQGHLRTSIPLTIRSALSGAIGAGTPKPVFKPSARLAAFAKGEHAVTGNPAQDLLLRFLTSAAVVGHGENAIPMGLAFNQGVS
jgi:hypothetical protein